MTSPTARRKDDHLRLALAQHDPARTRDTDHVRFVHHALAGGAAAKVSLASPAFDWSVPLYVSGMTGGSEQAAQVNRGLGVVARETGLPVAVGSMGIVLREPETLGTFAVLREENPDGFVLANTNANVSAQDAATLVGALAANALQVHVNAPQEIAMPEGDRAFGHWLGAIEEIVAAVDVPVIVKEVGAGLSRGTVAALRDLGVGGVDVAGRGGTDFAAIESARRGAVDAPGTRGYLAGWGQSAVTCLLESADLPGVGASRDGVALLASGGVRHALDVVTLLALGADAVGVAGEFLRVLVADGAGALVTLVEQWLEEIADIMALLGADSVAQLRSTDVLLLGPVREVAELRGIDVAAFARRSPWSHT